MATFFSPSQWGGSTTAEKALFSEAISFFSGNAELDHVSSQTVLKGGGPIPPSPPPPPIGRTAIGDLRNLNFWVPYYLYKTGTNVTVTARLEKTDGTIISTSSSGAPETVSGNFKIVKITLTANGQPNPTDPNVILRVSISGEDTAGAPYIKEYVLLMPVL